jgi:hypothetical protein
VRASTSFPPQKCTDGCIHCLKYFALEIGITPDSVRSVASCHVTLPPHHHPSTTIARPQHNVTTARRYHNDSIAKACTRNGQGRPFLSVPSPLSIHIRKLAHYLNDLNKLKLTEMAEFPYIALKIKRFSDNLRDFQIQSHLSN